ncbi:MAG: single-stranded-DNA-specific exonuclease RecJ [Thermodesulfovibrionales bacterium]|nr:single-stranded-DNA-specific exonuclease RecJ [Thermodesulfovibrionales bacterium]
MKRWLVNRTNQEYVDYISRIAAVSPVFAQVLINRGIKTSEQIYSFLNPSISNLSDPFDLPDIKKAIERIKESKRLGERVLIHGDYDADGVSATSVMVDGLRKYGMEVHYFIPNRMSHGYGFEAAGVQKAKEIGAGLIITVDCGITSFDAVSAASSEGIDVIVTDHHEPMRQNTEDRTHFLLPKAVAVVNPKLIAHQSSLAALSGAGVAFMLIYGLFGNIDDVYGLFDLAAIGTGADVVPLIEDNRIILHEGIKLIQSGERIGIKALKDAAGLKTDFFKTTFLYYVLIPRINAAGRIADATDIVKLLTTESEAEAEDLAKWLNKLNSQRQEIEEVVYQEAIEKLQKFEIGGAIVIASEGWHPGVVGIVASRIAEQYHRPTVILSIENGLAKGSARSILSFDIHHGLSQCSAVLKRFGGHKQAAGLSLLSEDIERFEGMLSGIVLNTLSDEDFVPVLKIDAIANIGEVSISLIEELSRLEPFGYGNEEPVLGAKGMEVIQPRVVGNNHLKMHLKQERKSIDCIGFGLGGLINSVDDKCLIDAAFQPIINEWNGGRYLQLNLKAIRPSTP